MQGNKYSRYSYIFTLKVEVYKFNEYANLLLLEHKSLSSMAVIYQFTAVSWVSSSYSLLSHREMR